MNTADDNLAFLTRDMIGRAYFGPVFDQREHDIGHRLMVDAILAGGDLVRVLLLADAADAIRGQRDQSAGAMAGLLVCLDALQAGPQTLHVRSEFGLAVQALQASGEMRRALLRCVPAERGAEVLELLLQAARAAAPYLKRAEPAPPPAAPPPPPAINVALQLPAGAVPVAIVSQLSTRSVQTVERDGDGEIVSTVVETTPALPAAA